MDTNKQFKEVIQDINKRRTMMFFVLSIATVVVFVVFFLFDIQRSTSLDNQTQNYLAFGLIAYKMIELFVIFKFFYHRHLIRYQNESHAVHLKKFQKNAKRFFMLVPQGNIVFGIICVKLLGIPYIFLLFMLFALSTLLLVQPKKLICV